jgi:purine-binding chemotaxis protein CheW
VSTRALGALLGAAMSDMYIVCQLADTLVAIPGGYVRFVEFVPEIAPVPNTPPFVEGVSLMRGQVIPLVSLRRRFDLPWRPHDLRSRVVVIRHGERVVGLLADSAHEAIHVSPDQIQPLADGAAQLNLAFLEGAFPHNSRLVLIARVEALIDVGAIPASASTMAG